MDYENDKMECKANISFTEEFEKIYGKRHPPFAVATLRSVCNLKKMILLYLHNSNDDFCKSLCMALTKDPIKNLVEQKYMFIGWNMTKPYTLRYLRNAFESLINVRACVEFIDRKQGVLFVLCPIGDTISVLSLFHKDNGGINSLEIGLKTAYKYFVKEVETEDLLLEQQQTSINRNNLGSKEFQQMMCDGLADRDYDRFEPNELKYLKEKIVFAFYGFQEASNGDFSSIYAQCSSNQRNHIDKIYNQILTQNNKYAQRTNQVCIATIFNCLEPLPADKLKKKGINYNPYSDMSHVPIFVIQKCQSADGSSQLCRIFIDHQGRVYESFNDYICDNNIGSRIMILPRNGRYVVDADDNVLLEVHLSPACGFGTKLIKALDLGATVGGVVSGGIFLAAAIPAVTVAPFALVAAGIGGIGVGLYSMVRSAYNVRDMATHAEDMGLGNDEARSHYLNLVAGTLGFAGAGATRIVSQLAAQGVNIQRGAIYTVNAINGANVAVCGAAVANSTGDIIKRHWTESQKPSMLMILQLSSSILFFGHSVYNFQTATTIIEKTQVRAIQEYQDSLRSNRHRKTYIKMLKETRRVQEGNPTRQVNADIIKGLRNIPNKDDMFAVLTRNNKLFNEEGVRFSIADGKINLNGVSIDLMQFGMLSKDTRTALLRDLPSSPTTVTTQAHSSLSSPASSFNLTQFIKNKLGVDLTGICWKLFQSKEFHQVADILLKEYSSIVKEKIVQLVKAVLCKLEQSLVKILNKLGAAQNAAIDVLKYVLNFLRDLCSDNKTVYRFEQILNFYVDGGVKNIFLKELLSFTQNQILLLMYNRKATENTNEPMYPCTNESTKPKYKCLRCNGFYYKSNKKSL